MIKYLKALSDNYIWIIEEEEGSAVIVDPSESQVVKKYLKENKITPVGIILTHNHEDHTGGVDGIKNEFDLTVYGPEECKNWADEIVEDGDKFNLLGKNFEVILSNGHTKGHISYLVEDNLFCGDALFKAGCGRVFTGDYNASFETMKRLRNLPDDTKVYAAHEYTVSNLKFVKSIRDDEKIKIELKSAEETLKKGGNTLPSTVEKEKEINPFLMSKDVDEFKRLRDEKDRF